MTVQIKVPQFRSFVDMSDFENIRQVFERNYIAEGPMGMQFRDKLLEVTGAPHGVLASNGTLAIYMAMRALGIGRGDEVIVQNVSFIASANGVEMAGARPVFVDIPAYDDLTVDLSRIKVTKKTKAIMVAHLFGTACSNIEEVVQFCKDHKLYLIEDAAQALYIRNGQKHCGTFGDIGTFSFYADKTVTTAEGGFVCTPHADVNERMVLLRNQGRKSSGTFFHPEIGYNFRLTDLQSALGLAQMAKIGVIMREKAKIAEGYERRLGSKVGWLKRRADFNYIPFRVIVFVENAEKTMAHMSAHGIEPRTMFVPFHAQPCYSDYKLKENDFPNSVECFRRGICLPTWIGLSDEQINHTCDRLLEAL
jgi:perosamine synthetase